MAKLPVPFLPSSGPGNMMIPFMSAAKRAQTIDTLFEMTGGIDKACAWIEKSDENYGEFFKIYAKGAVRPVSVEHNTGPGVEELLERLDEQERAGKALDITPKTRQD